MNSNEETLKTFAWISSKNSASAEYLMDLKRILLIYPSMKKMRSQLLLKLLLGMLAICLPSTYAALFKVILTFVHATVGVHNCVAYCLRVR